MLRGQAAPRAPILLAASAVAVPLTGTTNETALATVSIPAGSMGLNGAVQVSTAWSITSSANNKTMRVRFGGVSGTQYLASALTTNTTLGDIRTIRNRGAANSQVGMLSATNPGGYGNTSNAITTGAIDTAAAVDVVISGQLASAAETITLEAYEVWLLP
jgi:hypothetical protein